MSEKQKHPEHDVTSHLIRFTILALYKFLFMYVFM